MKKTAIIFAFFVLISLVFISGCSAPAKSNNDILNDVQQNSDAIKKYNVEIYDIKIEKRQTDSHNKKDTVFIWVMAKNDNIDCTIGLKVIYTLYNEGWMFDNIQDYSKNSWTISLLKGVSREDADNVISNQYENYDFVKNSNDLKNGVCKYTYNTKNSHNYISDIDTVDVIFTFDKESAEWSSSTDITNHNEEWNISGTWTYTYHEDGGGGYPDCDINATIQVDDFDGNTLNGSYSITYDYFNTLNFSKNGSIKAEDMPWSSDKMREEGIIGKGFIESWSTMSNDWTGFYFHKDKGVLFHNPYDGEWYQLEKK